MCNYKYKKNVLFICVDTTKTTVYTAITLKVSSITKFFRRALDVQKSVFN